MDVIVFERLPAAALALALIATSAGAVAGDGSEGEISDSRACRAGELRCVDGVIREMERRFEQLRKKCDHDAVFALTYLRTTEVFRDTALALGYDDVRAVTREDALFADYYFRAYDAYQAGPYDSGEGAVPKGRVQPQRDMPAVGGRRCHE